MCKCGGYFPYVRVWDLIPVNFLLYMGVYVILLTSLKYAVCVQLWGSTIGGITIGITGWCCRAIYSPILCLAPCPWISLLSAWLYFLFWWVHSFIPIYVLLLTMLVQYIGNMLMDGLVDITNCICSLNVSWLKVQPQFWHCQNRCWSCTQSLQGCNSLLLGTSNPC